MNVTYQGVTKTFKTPLTWFGQNFIFPDWTYWSSWAMNNLSENIKPNFEVLMYETGIFFEVTQQIHSSINELQYFLDNFVLFEFSEEFWSHEFGEAVDSVKTVYEKETGALILLNELKSATFKNSSYYALFNVTYYDPSRLHLLKTIDSDDNIELDFPQIFMIGFSMMIILLFAILVMKRELMKV